MALLGKDFSDSRPTDAEYVRHDTRTGALELRTLKQSIKDFFTVMMGGETGRFSNNVIPTTSLIPLDPNPEGTYKQATVNSKGMVVDGKEDPDGVPKYKLRAYITADPNFNFVSSIQAPGVQETKSGVLRPLTFATGLRLGGSTLSKSDDGWFAGGSFYYRRIDFFVPDRVLFLKYMLFQPYSTAYSTKGYGVIGSAYVYSGQQVKLILGSEENTAVTILGSRIRIADYSMDIGTGAELVDHTPLVSHTNYFRSRWNVPQGTLGTGQNAYYNHLAKYITPGFGFAILEWFEV